MEHLFSQEMKHQQELRGLQIIVQEKEQLLEAREARIVELEELMQSLSMQSLEESPVEEEVQCSLETEQLAEHTEALQRLTNILKQREEEGVGLHLATRDRDSEIMALRMEGQQKDGHIVELSSQLCVAEGEAIQREKKMEKLERQMGMLRNESRIRERELLEMREQLRESRRGEEQGRQRESALQQQLNQAQQNIQLFIIEHNKHREELSLASSAEAELQTRNEELVRQVEKYQAEVQQLRNVLNNYEWKQFCLETELDLAGKEKKQHKYVVDKTEQRLAELEAINREQRVTIYTLEEEHKILFDQNRQLSRELTKKDAFIHHLNQQQAQDERANVEELQYRINEKDEQLSALSNYLKEKIREADNFKQKSNQLQKQLEEMKVNQEKQQLESYELEQSLIQHEEIMEKQSQTIENYCRDIEFLNSKIHQEALHKILREGEDKERQKLWAAREEQWREKETAWKQEKSALMLEKEEREREDKVRSDEQRLWEKICKQSEKQYERQIMHLLNEIEDAQRQQLQNEEAKAKLQAELCNLQQMSELLKSENSNLSSYLVQIENDLASQTNRSNELSVEIIEREISNSKVAAQLESQQQEAEELRESLKQSTSMRLQLQVQYNQLQKALYSVEEADQKHRSKIVSLELTAQERNKLMNSLKSQITEQKNEIFRLNHYNNELQIQVDEAVEFLCERDQQIQELNIKAEKLNETGLAYAQEVQELEKKVSALEEEKQQLLDNVKNQQMKLETMKSELKQVHITTNERMKDIIEVLQRPVCEETVKFEVLEEEHDFQIIEGEQTQNHELLRKMEEYRTAISNICGHYEQQE